MARMDITDTNPRGVAMVSRLDAYCAESLGQELYLLVELRASLLNQCHYCIGVHGDDLRKLGESSERMAALEGSLPSRAFTDAENAALLLTDAVTRLGEGGVDDATWQEAARHFDEKQLGDLVLAIATINVWNRVGIATRMDEA